MWQGGDLGCQDTEGDDAVCAGGVGADQLVAHAGVSRDVWTLSIVLHPRLLDARGELREHPTGNKKGPAGSQRWPSQTDAQINYCFWITMLSPPIAVVGSASSSAPIWALL
jgi:hypothetical protein